MNGFTSNTANHYHSVTASSTKILEYDNEKGKLKVRLPILAEDSTKDSLDYTCAGTMTLYIVSNVIDLSETN